MTELIIMVEPRPFKIFISNPNDQKYDDSMIQREIEFHMTQYGVSYDYEVIDDKP